MVWTDAKTPSLGETGPCTNLHDNATLRRKLLATHSSSRSCLAESVSLCISLDCIGEVQLDELIEGNCGLGCNGSGFHMAKEKQLLPEEVPWLS